MATAYKVENRVMAEKVDVKQIKALELKYRSDVVIKNRHAVKFSSDPNHDKDLIVLVYEAPCDDFTGHCI